MFCLISHFGFFQSKTDEKKQKLNSIFEKKPFLTSLVDSKLFKDSKNVKIFEI